MYINHKSVIIQVCILTGLVMAGVADAEAANRFGMGRSIGRAPVSNAPHTNNPTNSNNPPPVTNVSGGSGAVVPSAPVVQKAPAQNTAPAPVPPAAAPVQMQQTPNQRSFMGTMMGGVAAGLGISWLMHSMGLGSQGWGGSGLDEILGAVLITLLGVVLVLVVRAKFMSHRRRDNRFFSNSASRAETTGTPTNPFEFSNYKAKNVGNDSSARPWEGDGASSVTGGYTPDAMPHYTGVPTGFDVKAFVNTAKQVFMTLQEAWDRSDMRTLHSMLTDQMLEEIKSQLVERERHASGVSSQTDVVTLQAELLGVSESQTEFTASVEFSGLIREDPTQGPSPFREVWSLCRPKDGATGWLVSGVQALE